MESKTDLDTMRANLKRPMSQAHENAHTLALRTGIPQPTTHRFLKGQHGEPKAETVLKWADAYGVTENQLRGYTPIAWDDNGTDDAVDTFVVADNSKMERLARAMAILPPDEQDYWIAQIEIVAAVVRGEQATLRRKFKSNVSPPGRAGPKVPRAG